MDLLEGPELMQALQTRDKYTEADVRLIMSSLLDAVAYMHMKGVTHRDLKLENCGEAHPTQPPRQRSPFALNRPPGGVFLCSRGRTTCPA